MVPKIQKHKERNVKQKVVGRNWNFDGGRHDGWCSFWCEAAEVLKFKCPELQLAPGLGG
jgi:hypothetical protein